MHLITTIVQPCYFYCWPAGLPWLAQSLISKGLNLLLFVMQAGKGLYTIVVVFIVSSIPYSLMEKCPKMPSLAKIVYKVINKTLITHMDYFIFLEVCMWDLESYNLIYSGDINKCKVVDCNTHYTCILHTLI
jgi:hypothetical protein